MPETLVKPLLAFTPEDAEQARNAWGFNCGPAALAAALRMRPDEVRPHLGDFRGLMNMTEMLAAIRSAGWKATSTTWPSWGVVRVQWHGPWTAEGANPRWAYRHTHWIATSTFGGDWVYDVNSGWVDYGQWCRLVSPAITRSISRADGRCSFTHCWEVARG